MDILGRRGSFLPLLLVGLALPARMMGRIGNLVFAMSGIDDLVYILLSVALETRV